MFDDDLLTEIRLTADLLNEIEAQRKRADNRRGAMTRTGPDSDGQIRGHGYRKDSYPVLLLDGYLDQLKVQEDMMIKALEGVIKRHPLAPWVAAQRGVGKKQAGRLLAVIGDPSWHPHEERPRTLPELWAYCGQVPGTQRRRGVPAADADQWSAEAKSRLFLVTKKVCTQPLGRCKEFQDPVRTWVVGHVEDCRCGPYRLVYEQRRAWTADRLHREAAFVHGAFVGGPCVRCGPSGRPAQPGSPWSLNHQRGDAHRYVGKRILRDLWREARALNGLAETATAA